MVQEFGGLRRFSFLSRQSHEGPTAATSGAHPAEVALLAARALESSEQPGPMSRALSEGAAANLREAWGALSSSEQRRIRERWGAEAVEEILLLSTVRDLSLAGEALFSLGGRLEGADRLDTAAAVYAVLAGAEFDGPLRQRAGTRLDAILGRGAVLPRAEFLGRRLAVQASDPAMIAGMAGAGLAFRMTRLAALSRLSAGSGLFARPLVARGLANAAGFGVESVAFTASVRGANTALGRSQDWSARALWHEYAAGALTLGALKFTGALARVGVSRLGPHPSALGRVGQVALPQAALFGGILLSHDLEARLGLRPRVDGATSLTDALGTLLQFHVGGRLARDVSGPRLHLIERELERRALAMEAEGSLRGRIVLQRPLHDHLPERLVSWARRLGRLGRGALYSPLWMAMGVGIGGGFGGPPRRFVETRTLRVENIPVRVEIFHRQEITRDSIQRLERGLREIFEEGKVPLEFDGEAENLAADRHYILQRLRNGGPTMRARLEVSALGTIARFEITEEGRTPYVFAPESQLEAAPESVPETAVEPASPEPDYAAPEADAVRNQTPTVVPQGDPAESAPRSLLPVEIPARMAPAQPENAVESPTMETEVPRPSAARESRELERIREAFPEAGPILRYLGELHGGGEAWSGVRREAVSLLQAIFSSRGMAASVRGEHCLRLLEALQPSSRENGPRQVLSDLALIRQSLGSLEGMASSAAPVEPATLPPPAHYVPWAERGAPPGMRPRPPHRRLMGIPPEVQPFEMVPGSSRARAEFELSDREFSVDSEVEALLGELHEEIRAMEPREAAEAIFHFLIEQYGEYEGAMGEPPRNDVMGGGGNRRRQDWNGTGDSPESGDFFGEPAESGLKFLRSLQGVRELIQRHRLGNYHIQPERHIPSLTANPLLSAAYSSVFLRSWIRGGRSIPLGSLVEKLIRTFDGRDYRGVMDLAAGRPRRTSPQNDPVGSGAAGAERPSQTLAPPPLEVARGAPDIVPEMPSSQGDPSEGPLELRPEVRGTEPSVEVRAREPMDWRSTLARLESLRSAIGDAAARDPVRGAAAQNLYFQIRALRLLGVSPEAALELAELFRAHLARGSSFRNVERDFHAAARTRIHSRLAGWLEAGAEWSPVVRRALNLLREFSPARGWSLERSVTALDVLERIVQGDPRELRPAAWIELFDSFESRIRREAPFAEVLDELQSARRNSRPAPQESVGEGAPLAEAATGQAVRTGPPPDAAAAVAPMPFTLMMADTEGAYRPVSMEELTTAFIPGRGLTSFFGRPTGVATAEVPASSARPEGRVMPLSLRGNEAAMAAEDLEVLREDLAQLPRGEALTRVLEFLYDRLPMDVGNPARMTTELRRGLLRLPSDFLPRLRGVVREFGLGNENFLNAEAMGGLGLNRHERRSLASQSRLRTLDQLLSFLERLVPRSDSRPERPRRGEPRVRGRTASGSSETPISPSEPASPAVVLGREARSEPSPAPDAANSAEGNSGAPATGVSEPEFRGEPLHALEGPRDPVPVVASDSSLSPVLPVETPRVSDVAIATELPAESPPEAQAEPPAEVRSTPVPPRPSSPSLASRRLSSLLPAAPELPLQRIEGYLRANEMQRRLIVPPTLAEFAAVRAALEARLPEAEASETAAIRGFLRLMEEGLREPTLEQMRAFSRAALPELGEAAARRFESLSEPAQRGLYLLVLALPASQRPNLAAFLANPEVARMSGGAEEVLRGVALLHDLGVRGYEQGFVPVPSNPKFLGMEENTLQGANGEYLEALRTALDPNVDRVWMGTSLRIRWDRLPAEQRQFIEREVRPLFEVRSYDYTRQQASEVDMVYRTVDGRRRLVEVKVSRRAQYSPGPGEIGKILLQVFRHALLVRQHNLEGVEYRISAPSVAPQWIARLRDVLNLTGVPWVLTVRETASGRTRVFEGGMSALAGEGAPPPGRLRPIPEPPRPPAVLAISPVLPVAREGAEEPWSGGMIDFLNRGLEGQDKISRRANREEGMAHLIDQLRVPPQLRLADSIENFLNGAGSTLPEPRVRRISELLRQFRHVQGQTMSRGRVGLLFEIAALCVGESRTAEETRAEGGAILRGVEQNLQNHPELWAETLRSWRQSLLAIETLASEMDAEEMQAALDEYSADRTVEISMDRWGNGGASLRELQEALQEGRISAPSELAEAIREVVEIHDAQRGALLLRQE